ncbi:MAG: site-specific integrase [Nitrospinae bacterium]|nr:site-specific integrase [Nitrospinota bacterium]
MSTIKRGKVYYSRLYVPSKLHQALQKKEVVKSLRTSSHPEAITRSCILEGRIARLWSVLKYELITMTPKQINKLIQQYTKATLEECEEDRLSNLKKYNDNDLESISFVIVEKLEENYVNLMDNDFSEITEVANKLLTKNGLTVASESIPFKKLCRELLIAEQKVLKTELKRWGGDYADQLIKFEAKDEPDEVPTELLSKVIEAHIKEHKNIWEPRGVKQAQSSLHKFLEFTGDKPIGTIEKEHTRGYKGYLSNEPNGRGGTLSSASINKHLSYVVTLFNWGKDQGFCFRDNPASGLKVKSSRRADEERSALTASDLKVIFSDDYPLLKDKRPDRFFIPLILLHTGARVGEVAQLGINDVKKESGVWCFDIHPSSETSVKTKSSIRLVPVHSYLIKAGFIEYCEEIRKDGHTQLFPALKQSANGYGSAISKWFNKRLREKGIVDKKKVLHSTRHTFISKLKQLDIQDHLISELVGHTVESITVGRYGKKLDVKALRKAIEKLKYPFEK